MQILEYFRNSFVHEIIKKIRTEMRYHEWIRAGRQIPPVHAYKEKELLAYASKFKIDVFIETGTYVGHTVDALKRKFKVLYTIELNPDYVKIAKKNLIGAKNVFILQGDSGKLIDEIIKKIQIPCLFWLDAHYSGGSSAKGDEETPILTELKIIFNHSVKKHIVLIDDARLFNGINGYPTLERLKEVIAENSENKTMVIEHDIIRIF